jgi:polyphenol oxidase
MTLPMLHASDLQAVDCIRHGFFTREGGVSEGIYATLNSGWKSGDDIEKVGENRRRIATQLGVAANNLITCYQIHSAMVISVTEPWRPNDRPEADAMVTDRPGLALGILTADCVPLLLVDPKARVIGAAHAGWRGAVSGVIDNTVDAMRKLGAKPGNITAALGPCIWQNNYEVGAEFPAPFLALDPTSERFFRPAFRSGHYMFDLPGWCIQRLRGLGVVAISAPPADTYREPEKFYSFRHAAHHGTGKTGSLMSAVCLV